MVSFAACPITSMLSRAGREQRWGGRERDQVRGKCEPSSSDQRSSCFEFELDSFESLRRVSLSCRATSGSAVSSMSSTTLVGKEGGKDVGEIKEWVSPARL